MNIEQGDTSIYFSTASGFVYAWDTQSGAVLEIADTGLSLTDIAISPEGVLYGITSTDLYRINTSTSAAEFIGQIISDEAVWGFQRFAATTANGFDISPTGVARVSSADSVRVVTIDLDTGYASNSLSPTSRTSSGDIWYTGDERYTIAVSNGLFDIGPFVSGNGEGTISSQFADSGIDGLVQAPVDALGVASGTLIGFVGDAAYDIRQTAATLLPPLQQFSGVGEITGATALRPGAGAPSNEAPTIIDPGLITVQAGTDVVFDLVATDDEDSEGAGLSFTNNPAPDQLNFRVNPNTGEITFDFVPTGDPAEDADGDNIHELTVEVTDSGGFTDTVDLRVQVVPEEPEPTLQSASSLEMEYFARQSAYGYSPILSDKDDSVLEDGTFLELEELLVGWRVEEVFGESTDTFRAIALRKDGFIPVIAIRGTSTELEDWAENFRTTGVGEEEFNARVVSTGLADWINENNVFSITGHSQGGAQAQLLSIFASTINGASVEQLYTFNSAGISNSALPENFLAPREVEHFVNASDVVSLVGETFISGGAASINYYDFTDTFESPFQIFASAHTGHWSQNALRIKGIDFYQGDGTFLSSGDLPSSTFPSGGPSLDDFGRGQFNPLQDYGQDNELVELVDALVGALSAYQDFEGKGELFFSLFGFPRLDLTTALTGIAVEQLRNDLISNAFSRDGWEELRTTWGPELINLAGTLESLLNGATATIEAFGELGRSTRDFWVATGSFAFDTTVALGNLILDGTVLAGKATTGLGSFLLDSTEGVLLQTWTSASDLGSWIDGRFAPDEDIVVAEGNHAGSTPAIVLNIEETENELLSSSSSGSIFLLTDPGTTVEIESGNNIIWGVAGDQSGTSVSADFSVTDVHFIQNEFFATENLSKEEGSAIIGVDLDQDGQSDITLTWEGSYHLPSIIAEQTADGTYVRYLGNPVDGSVDRDSLNGTTGSDAVRSYDGRQDDIFGDQGVDQFIFGAEVNNGTRERDVILDYEVGVDEIVLEDGAYLVSIRETSSEVIVFVGDDRDTIYVRGDGVTANNITIVTDDVFDFV